MGSVAGSKVKPRVASDGAERLTIPCRLPPPLQAMSSVPTDAQVRAARSGLGDRWRAPLPEPFVASKASGNGLHDGFPSPWCPLLVSPMASMTPACLKSWCLAKFVAAGAANRESAGLFAAMGLRAPATVVTLRGYSRH